MNEGKVLHVSLARGVVDKDQAGLRRATADKSWTSSPDGYSVEEFLDAVTVSGSAWSYQFTDGRPKKSEFAGSNVVGIDVENKGSGSFTSIDELASDPFISQNALLVYTTANSKPGDIRARVLFLLPAIEADSKKFEETIARVVALYPGRVDTACKDSARRFYGSRGAEVCLIGRTLDPFLLPEVRREVAGNPSPVLTNVVPGGRNIALFDLARSLVGRHPVGTAEVMVLGLNASLAEPLPEGEVRTIVRGVYARSTIEGTVQEMNLKFAVVWIGAKTAILDLTDPGDVVFRQVGHFRTFYQNRTVPGPQGRPTPVADFWLSHPERREYEKVVFDPRPGVPAEYFNLFRGFTKVEPAEVPFDVIEYHIAEVVADGNPDVTEYILKFLAHLLRKPEEKPGVAIAMKGKKGTGKGSFIRIVEGLVGAHLVVTVANRDHLVGKFNRHLADKLVLFADEAFFAGNPEVNGPLKSLITEPTVMIEAKGVDAITVDSYHRVIFASNEKWVVPASEDERRYMVTTLSERHANDRDYFNRLYEAIPREIPGFLKYLLDLDISSFNRFMGPKTDALRDQVAFTDSPFDSWIKEFGEREQIVLREGRPGEETDRLLIDLSDPKRLLAPVTDVYQSYLDEVRAVGARHPIPKEAFGRELSKRFKVRKVRKRGTDGILTNFYQFDGKEEPESEPPF